MHAWGVEVEIHGTLDTALRSAAARQKAEGPQ